jgi:hypothetical protein
MLRDGYYRWTSWASSAISDDVATPGRNSASASAGAVSVVSPKDGQTHTVNVTASNKLDAAVQAIESWSRL